MSATLNLSTVPPNRIVVVVEPTKAAETGGGPSPLPRPKRRRVGRRDVNDLNSDRSKI